MGWNGVRTTHSHLVTTSNQIVVKLFFSFSCSAFLLLDRIKCIIRLVVFGTFRCDVRSLCVCRLSVWWFACMQKAKPIVIFFIAIRRHRRRYILSQLVVFLFFFFFVKLNFLVFSFAILVILHAPIQEERSVSCNASIQFSFMWMVCFMAKPQLIILSHSHTCPCSCALCDAFMNMGISVG